MSEVVKLVPSVIRVGPRIVIVRASPARALLISQRGADAEVGWEAAAKP
jgi:hypothetical protein